MNQHVLQGKWRQLRGGFKKQWGRLTDDDLRRIQGSLDQILGVVQQRYGYTRSQAEQEIDRYLDAYQDQMSDYSERMKAYGKQLDAYGDQMRDYNEQMQSQVRTAMKEASSRMDEQRRRAADLGDDLRKDASDTLSKATGQRRESGGGSAWAAVIAGFALFAIVIYLFNRQSSSSSRINS